MNTGWICPVCSRGLAIWVAECPCYKNAGENITITGARWHFDVKDSCLNEFPRRIPWDVLNPRIKYVAMDSSGDWWGYEDKPFQNTKSDDNNEWGWDNNELYKAWLLDAVKMPSNIPWTESLAKRPF